MIKNVLGKNFFFYGWIVVIFASILLFYQNFILHKNLNSDISSILPTEQREAVELNKVFNQLAAKNVIWLIKSTSKDKLEKAVISIEESLSDSPILSINKNDERMLVDFYQLLLDSPSAFLSKKDRVLLNDSHQSTTSSRLEFLFSPISTINSSRLQRDPLLFAENSIKAISNKSSSTFQIQSYLGYFYNDLNYLLINLELNGSPFDLNLQEQYLEKFKGVEDKVRDFDGELLQLGVIGFAATETQQGLFEAKYIGLGSLISIFLLVAIIFRSISPLLLISLVIGVSVLVALALSSVVFSKLHILSVLVGSSLIGISVDYVFHYFAKNTIYKSSDTVLKIFKPVSLGLLTSVLGYLALYFSGLLVLKQIALISSIGLIAAYFSTLLLLPKLPLDLSKKNNTEFKFFRFLNALTNSQGYKSASLVIGIGILVAGITFNSSIQFNDKLELMHASPELLTSQQTEIETVVREARPGYNLVIKADDDQELLELSESLGLLLESELSAKNISGYFAPHQFIASFKQQKLNQNNIIEWLRSESIDEYLSLIDMQQEKTRLIERFSNKKYLSMEDLDKSPLANYLRQLVIRNDDGSYYGLIKLNDVIDSSSILAFANNNNKIFNLDTKSSFTKFLAKVRGLSIELVIYAYLVILGLLLVVYGFSTGLRLFLPPLAAAVFSILVAVGVGQQLNVFHVVALTLVLGIGIDYTIFYASPSDAKKSDMVMAITCSMLSTVLAFGLMSFSATPAVAGFGTIVLSGIIMAYLLAPMAKSYDK